MVLSTSPGTGEVLGLRLSLSTHPGLEKIRLSKDGNQSKWFSVFSSVMMSYKVFKIYRFSKQYEDCPTRVLSKLAVSSMEDYGSFEFVGKTKPHLQLFDEARLLACCAWSVVRGNSVRYEFGFRWFHQTNFDFKFRSSFLEVLEVSPVTAFGSDFHSLPVEDSSESFDDATFVKVFDDQGVICGATANPIGVKHIEEPREYVPAAVQACHDLYRFETGYGDFEPEPTSFFDLSDEFANLLEKLFEEADPSVSVLDDMKEEEQKDDALMLCLESVLASTWPSGDFQVEGYFPDFDAARDSTSHDSMIRWLRIRAREPGISGFLSRNGFIA
jgi:hypothetical protein